MTTRVAQMSITVQPKCNLNFLSRSEVMIQDVTATEDYVWLESGTWNNVSGIRICLARGKIKL